VLCLVRGDTVTDVQLDRHDPLGMFDGSRYVAQDLQLEPGDRLVVVSDGVHAAMAGGRRYGDYDLRRLINRCRNMPPIDVVRTLVGELRAFVAGDLADDAATVCLDWSGRPST
jgi:serine phosphatase RsbU (regulator of sigma subunit)